MNLKEKTRIQLEYGSPVEIICKAAEQEKYDLIIIGNRGLNRFQRVLMGSVSSKVVTLAPCPVLVIK
jgi:nucleotide-binding universal stress UspA family protein